MRNETWETEKTDERRRSEDVWRVGGGVGEVREEEVEEEMLSRVEGGDRKGRRR